MDRRTEDLAAMGRGEYRKDASACLAGQREQPGLGQSH